MNEAVPKGISLEPFLAPEAFDPETTAMLAAAFDTAWDTIVKSGSLLLAERKAPAMRELVAKGIIEMAQMGERDPKRLVEIVVGLVAAPDRT
jgi:hypothetical protein